MPTPLPTRFYPVLAACVVAFVAPAARADVVRPGYVETCTLESQKSATVECHACSASHSNIAHCADSLMEYGFERRCQTGGASAWSEVWCREVTAAAKAVPRENIDNLGNPRWRPVASSLASPPASGAPTAAAPTSPATPTSPSASASPAASASSAATPTTPPSVDPKGASGGCGSCVVGPTVRLSTIGGALALAILVAAGLRTRRSSARPRR